MDEICWLPTDPTAEEKAMDAFREAVHKYRWYRGLNTRLAMTLQQIGKNPMIPSWYIERVGQVYSLSARRMFKYSDESEALYLRVLKERQRSGNQPDIKSGD